MAKQRVRFTDQRLRTLQYYGTGNKRQFLYDSVQPKLALQVTSNNSKTFYLHGYDSIRKRSVVKKIGSYPETSITEARDLTILLLGRIHKGENIIATARQVREEDTFERMFTRWLESAKQHKRTWETDQSRYNNYISKPLGQRQLSDIDKDMIKTWFHNLAKKHGLATSTSNRILAIVKTVFNQELPDRPNPCSGIKMYHENSRHRFLQPSELQQFFRFLFSKDTPIFLQDYVLLSLYTGGRKSNVLGMRWKDIDLQLRIWTIRGKDSKNKSTMTIPLISEVIAILKRRKAATSSIFVLPSVGRKKSKTGHLVDPRGPWQNLLSRAGIEDFRLHDLRRTMGSWQTITGASTAVVGKTLGHKSPEATAVYARLNLDPVRASMEKAVEAMLKTQELPEKISKITTK